MARPLPWHLERETYPYSVDVPPRYSDLDSMGHINNVAIAGMFETARVGFHHVLHEHPGDLRLRWLVAALHLNYVDEMHYPHAITIGSGFLKVGRRSWTILAGAFQNGRCCATCETVVVVQGNDAEEILARELKGTMEPWFVRAPADAAP